MEKININGKEFTAEELNKLIEESKKPKYNFVRKRFDVVVNYGFPTTEAIIKYDADTSINFFEKAMLMYNMQQFADEHNGDWMADFDDSNQKKWGIIFDIKGFYIEHFFKANPFVFGIPVKSKEIATAMLEEFKDELEIYLK